MTRTPLQIPVFLVCWVASIAAMAVPVANATPNEDKPLNGSFEMIQVERGRVLNHGYFSFNKIMIIDGTVQGGLVCYGGQTTIRGTVTGNVTIIGGMLEIDQTAEIGGKIVTLGSPFVGPELPVDRHLDIPLKKPFYPGEIDFIEKLKRSVARVIITFLFSGILLFLIPHRVRQTGLEIRTDWIPTFFAGALTLVVFVFCFACSTIFFGYPVGALLFLVFALLFLIAGLFGLVGVLEAIASFVSRFLPSGWSFIHALFLACILFEILSLLPWLGLLFQWIALALGLGGVLLTRFGSNRDWFTHKKKVWLG